MSLANNKALLLTLLLVVLVMLVFWLGSRFPALDEKALMGGETQIAALGFDILLDIPSKASLLTRISFNTINWMYTNWRGMLFGILMGALLLTLLPLLSRHSFRSRFANSLMGMIMGSPLGVCVNCATPIAQGVFAAGGRTETVLAVMLSSPTLNVIVLTMVFALFPIYMALTKVGLTVLFILVGIPLMTRLLPFPVVTTLHAAQQNKLKHSLFHLQLAEIEQSALLDTWCQSAIWIGQQLGRNLFYIIKITVPLMILAGILGSSLVTILPLETLAELLPTGGRLVVLFSMIGVAFIGLFLPVPIAFDVIVTAVLLQAGLPVNYAMVLLFTLGIFSIYPFFLIWRTMSKTIATSLYLGLAGLGVVAGVAAHQYHQWDFIQQQKLILQRFAETSKAPVKPEIDRTRQGQQQTELVPELQQAALIPTPYYEQGNLSVARLAFAALSGVGEQQFSRIEGTLLGLNEHDNASIQKLSFRFAESRGIASGDIHNDGWSDVVIASDSGIGLYANKQGSVYQQQRLDIPELNNQYVGNVALVDINNDGWLDLFFSTFREGSFVIYNQHGMFIANNVRRVPNHADAVLANAPAFGDIDRNGKLDIVLGNAATGNLGQLASLDSSRNVWLKQIGQEFVLQSLPAIAGETLTTLLADINHDGWLDLIVGNEFKAPDIYYLNNGRGGFEMATKQDGLIPYTGATTMSLTSADINNDLVPEIFLAQKAWENNSPKPQPSDLVCADITTENAHQNCLNMHRLRDVVLKARTHKNAFECLKLETIENQNGCLALTLINNARVNQDETTCELLSPGWPILAGICSLQFNRITQPTESQLDEQLSQIVKRNMLFLQDESGNYQDHASTFGLQYAGWAWNAKFADLDNDGWQDLYVVTGFLPVSHRHLNYLFHNQQGTGFKNITQQAGLYSWLDTLAYTYTDMDNDGDLDIITVPAVGPVTVYRNNTQTGHSISFQLRDYQGNRFGIGSTIIIHYGDGGHQMRDIVASGGFLSFDAPIAHFGLGEINQIKGIEIQWSTGEVSKMMTPFESGANYIITRQDKTIERL